MMNNPHNVKVGQLWGDCDPRMGGREFRVTHVSDTHATVQVTTENRNSYKRGGTSRIVLTRFRPTSTGYRLIEDVAR